MKIVHSGLFLGEGLRQLGHEVADVRLRPDAALTELVEAACDRPDLVVLEVWGKTDLPGALALCPHRVALYCVDSVLNEFWLRPLALAADDVFVDQVSSVAAFRGHGVNASWLPLCVNEGDFMPEMETGHFLAFVGRTTRFRRKRSNLLRLLQRHFPVTLVENVSRREMLTLFARSRVVLNENLFSGLTLRVFQGLASGSVLLTEAGGRGVAEHFTGGEHLVCYDPTSVLRILDDMRAHGDRYREIGRRGQALCRERHTSFARARTFLDHLAQGRAANPRKPTAERLLAEAKARYFHALRFGGPYAEAVRVFAESGAHAGDLAREAAHCLGSVLARTGEEFEARPALVAAAGLAGPEGFVAAAKLALTHLYRDEPGEAARILQAAALRLPQSPARGPVPDVVGQTDARQAVFVWLAEVLLELDQVLDLGFLKAQPERYPDCAFEYARLAWDAGHTAQTLDLLIRCASASGTESEIMESVQSAIEEGVATDAQILYAAELAMRLYDSDTAKAITASFRRSQTLRRDP